MNPAIAMALGGAALGGLAGAMGSKNTQTYSTTVAPASALENQATGAISSNLGSLQDFTKLGPGAADVSNGLDAQRNLAALFQQYSQGGFMPNQNDVSSAQNYASQIFAPQIAALQAQFRNSEQQSNQMAARMGRASFDPILRNKLAQTQADFLSPVLGQQTAFAADYANNLPMQRLNFAQQYAGVQNGLASQAMANRQALLSMGQQLKQGEQNFRVATATKTMENATPGGWQGALQGALVGAGAGMQAGSFMGGGRASGGGGATLMAGNSYAQPGNIS